MQFDAQNQPPQVEGEAISARHPCTAFDLRSATSVPAPMTSIPVSVNYDEQLGKNASTSLFLSVHFTCSTGLLCLLLYLKHLNGYAFRLTKALDNRVAFTWVGLPVAFFPTILISLLGSSRVSHPRVGLACVLQQRHLVPGPGKRYISSDPRRQYSSKASTAPEALNLEHSQFLSEAPPNAKWNGGMNNGERSVDELEGVEDGRGEHHPPLPLPLRHPTGVSHHSFL